MVEILGTGAESETTQVYEEGRSMLGSLVTQLIGIMRQVMAFTLRISGQIIAWAGENPLAMTLAISNIIIWMS